MSYFPYNSNLCYSYSERFYHEILFQYWILAPFFPNFLGYQLQTFQKVWFLSKTKFEEKNLENLQIFLLSRFFEKSVTKFQNLSPPTIFELGGWFFGFIITAIFRKDQAGRILISFLFWEKNKIYRFFWRKSVDFPDFKKKWPITFFETRYQNSARLIFSK